MTLRRARGVDQSVDRVPQAVFVVGDRSTVWSATMPKRWPGFRFSRSARDGRQGFRSVMWGGNDIFGREDLPFMDLAGKYVRKRFHSIPCSNRSMRPIAMGSMRAGMMPEQAFRKMPFGGQTRALRLED
ncbi:hypothetical protein [Thiorhodococcus fuscus]|uniref:Uncharacterized protein n=1 Tax=Thiorhodococcus fuscus TaxID=527200 RepID=A0ABW4Y853_9GAMM